MGYTTDFTGSFQITPTLKPEHKAYIDKFSETRRYKRVAEFVEKLPDPIRIAAGLPIGVDGGFYVAEDRYFSPAGSTRDKASGIVDYNDPPTGQPGLWCQWISNKEGTGLEWDNGEKFYHYDEWLVYLIETFLKPWGYTLNGEVDWFGEDREDIGKLRVKDNVVSTLAGKIVFEEE